MDCHNWYRLLCREARLWELDPCDCLNHIPCGNNDRLHVQGWVWGSWKFKSYSLWIALRTPPNCTPRLKVTHVLMHAHSQYSLFFRHLSQNSYHLLGKPLLNAGAFYSLSFIHYLFSTTTRCKIVLQSNLNFQKLVYGCTEIEPTA